MQTKLLKKNQINKAVDLLRQGELVALPTETVYGLAADAHNEIAIKKIFSAKGRPSDHPLILHIDSLKKINDWAKNISIHTQTLADNFWPGPLTMILTKQNHISSVITGGLDNIAIRIPNHPVTLEVINKLGNAIVAPSANSYQKISPTKPIHVLKTLEGKIAAVLDGGISSIGIESTIIDMTGPIPIILRPGAITKEMIENVLKIEIKCPSKHNQKVSGNMENHYQPEKPLFLLSIDEIEHIAQKQNELAIMYYSNISKNSNSIYYRMPKNKIKYAKNLYNALHEIDNTDAKKILVEMPPSHNEWADIIDRLVKASKKIG